MMKYFKKHTVLSSSVVVLGVALVFAIPQINQHQDLRQRAQTSPTGNQLYVSPDGSGDCSQASPCSLTAADGKATPGTIILAAPGTYKGPFATTKGGTAGNFITYKSQTKHGAIITSNGEGSSMSVVEIKNEYVRFQDFTITGAQARHGFHLDANNVEVIGNHIHTLVQWQTGNTGWKGGAGIQTGSPQMSGLVIDSNEIDHIGAPGSTESLVHGMYIDAHVTNSRVSNNLIHDVEDFGLHPYPESEASGWQFINNTIVNTGRGILQAPNGVTRNNIVFNTRGDAYDIRGSGNVVSNNLAGGTGGSSGVSGVTSGDPMFVNAASGDYHLKAGSPAIDKGSTEGAPQNDYDGKTRPQGAGIDIGAFEGDGSGGAVSPGATAPSGTANPTFGVIAPCPSCASPTQAISPAASMAPGPTGSTSTDPISPNPQLSAAPCEDTSIAEDNHKKKKSKHKGSKGEVSNATEKLIALLIELLNKLLELLGGGQIEVPGGVDVPDEPVTEPSPATQNPC